MEDKITILSMEVTDKNTDILRESLNFISTIGGVKLSDSQIEELLTGKLVMSLDEFILFFQVYSIWYNNCVVKIWIKQDTGIHLYTFKNKEYLITP